MAHCAAFILTVFVLSIYSIAVNVQLFSEISALLSHYFKSGGIFISLIRLMPEGTNFNITEDRRA